jgi:hypothetical protein
MRDLDDIPTVDPLKAQLRRPRCRRMPRQVKPCDAGSPLPRTESFPESPFQEALTEGKRHGQRLRGSRTYRPTAFRGSIHAVRRSHHSSPRHHPRHKPSASSSSRRTGADGRMTAGVGLGHRSGSENVAGRYLFADPQPTLPTSPERCCSPRIEGSGKIGPPARSPGIRCKSGPVEALGELRALASAQASERLGGRDQAAIENLGGLDAPDLREGQHHVKDLRGL